MENICPKCGSEFKVVPAGVSKRTGKPYQAFTVCSNKECDGRPSGNTYSKPVDTGPKWEEIRKEKKESISWLNAKNNATLLACHDKISKEQIAEWTDKIHNINQPPF